MSTKVSYEVSSQGTLNANEHVLTQVSVYVWAVRRRAHTDSDTDTYIRTRRHAYVHGCIHRHAYVHGHAHADTHMYTDAHGRRHAYVHRCMHTHTHTNNALLPLLPNIQENEREGRREEDSEERGREIEG